MSKIFSKKFIRFLSIGLLIIVSYICSQFNLCFSKNDPNTNAEAIVELQQFYRDVSSDINSINKRMDSVEKKLDQTISGVNEIINSFKVLSPELTNRILTISKEHFQTAKNYYDSLKAIVWSTRIIIWLSPIFLIGIFIGFFLKKKAIINWIYVNFKLEEKENICWAKILHQQGLQHYYVINQMELNGAEENDLNRKNMLDLAISSGEEALNRIQKVFNEKPRDKEEDILLARICNALCYYYAMKKDNEKFPEGLKYAKESLEKGEKYSKPQWIETYIYFVMRFPASHKSEKLKAKDIFDRYKDTFSAKKIVRLPLFKAYEDFFAKTDDG